jgi:hypothetical protein
MSSVDSQILKKIKYSKRGTVFFPDDFIEYGSTGAIRIALHRLVVNNELKRVAQGIYIRPKISQLVGEVMPTAEEIAKAIAKRDRARIVPTGSYALNALGLSTQVPLKLVYLTDGAPRKVKIGKRTISFKKTTPKNLAAKGEISGLVIQALKAIGNGKVSEEEEKKIIVKLQNEEVKKLKHDIRLAPAWVASIMKKAL